jgi:hypothetical protein
LNIFIQFEYGGGGGWGGIHPKRQEARGKQIDSSLKLLIYVYTVNRLIFNCDIRLKWLTSFFYNKLFRRIQNHKVSTKRK